MGNWYTDDVKYIAGVGEARAKLLDKELGIATVGDLLYHFPFRYIDRTKIYRIAEIGASGQTLVQFRGRVTGVAYAGAGRKRRFTAYVADATGQAELVWFQGIKWIEKRIEVGREYLVFGRPSFFRNDLSLVHPEVETVEKALSRRAESGLQGIYSSTERLSSVLGTKGFHTIVSNAWRIAGERIGETLPPEMRRQYGLATLREALYNIHFPQSPEALRQAQYRLKFEELLGVQLNVMARRSERLARNDGFYFARVGESFNTFYKEKLPFPLTGAQKRVVREIRQDTVTGCQMNRLLQGDVGSGKTLVAVMCMLMALDNCCQTCLMAPTEILATQHYETIQGMLGEMGITVALLTGSTKKREREEIHRGLQDGSLQILIGTHALLEDVVSFQNIGLVIIDEQHRFGVAQRAKLWQKNTIPPHVLVMTATPIPRTLAMTLYGDLDVSVIDELPPGRKPITTFHAFDKKRLEVFQFIEKELLKGRQAYVVYPLIYESEKMDFRNLEEGYEQINNYFLPKGYKVGMVHGKLKPAEKDSEMRRFVTAETKILVSTTVIEVGVNVPNASIMVIESAERFGLSQLHQLRGRVGRGADQSYCILMTSYKISNDSRKRIDTMTATNDGFEIAEADLKLRGPGDIEGTQQSGLTCSLKVANLGKDTLILNEATRIANGILSEDADLIKEENQLFAIQIKRLFKTRITWRYIS